MLSMLLPQTCRKFGNHPNFTLGNFILTFFDKALVPDK